VLEKMSALKIDANEKTYNYLIRSAGYAANIQQAEEYFRVATSSMLYAR